MTKNKKQSTSGVQPEQNAPAQDAGQEVKAPEATAAEAAHAQNAEQPATAQQQPQKPRDLTQLKVERSCSRSLAGWLAQNRLSLAITSYQSGRIYLVGSDKEGRASFFERIFERAMGVVGNAQRIYLGGLFQLWRFENILASNQIIHGKYDKCYVPRNAQTIGDVDIHELGIR